MLGEKKRGEKCRFSRRYESEGKKHTVSRRSLSCYVNRTRLRVRARGETGRYWPRDEEGAASAAPIGRPRGWGMRATVARRILGLRA